MSYPVSDGRAYLFITHQQISASVIDIQRRGDAQIYLAHSGYDVSTLGPYLYHPFTKYATWSQGEQILV